MLTDSHFDKNNIVEVEDVLDQAIDLCIENNVKTIFSLGDAFTSRTGQTLSVLIARKNWLSRCRDKDIDVFEIPGNHDKTDLESEDSYLDIYSDQPNYHLYKKEKVLRFHGLICCFLPYFPEDGSYPKRLQDLAAKARKSPEKKLLFTHIAVDGVKNNDGTEVSNTLSGSLFKTFDSVFVGHYHNRSQVGKNIHYIGSPRPKDFGEDDNKGFTILYDDGSFEYTKARFRRFIKIKVDVTASNNAEIETLISKYSNSEHRVRFVVSGEEEDLALLNTSDFSKVGIELKKEPTRISRAISGADEVRVQPLTKASILTSFIQYCKDNGIEGKLKKKGLSYLK